MERNNHLPYWIFRIKEETLRKQTADIYRALQNVYKLNWNYGVTQSDGDWADLEAAKEDLRDVMLEVYNQGNNADNPLWNAVMQIRPKVIDGTLGTLYAKTIADVLWSFIKEADETENEEVCLFFRRLAVRMSNRTINFYRAVISGSRGGPFEERGNNGSALHYFPGIPKDVMYKAGVRLTTRPENLEAVKAAYAIMRDSAHGLAQAALSAHLQDIESIAAAIFRPQAD